MIGKRDPNYDIACSCWGCGEIMEFNGKDDYVATHYNGKRIFLHLTCYLTK